MRKHLFCLLTLSLLWPAVQNWGAAAQAPAAEKKKQVKDAQEADLFNSILKEANPTQKLQLLDQWKQKYPETDYQEERWKFYMQAYQQAGQAANALNAAKEVLKLAPGDFSANLTIAFLVPTVGSSDASVLPDGEKAAQELLRAQKPEAVSDADWANATKTGKFLAHQTLGWIAMQQKKNEVAEQEFIKALEVSPGAAQISVWLGTAVTAQKNPDKNTLALFSFARAAAYDGEGALPPANRKQMDDYLTKAYNNYHGADAAALAELKKLAKASALPPAGLRIRSKEEIQAEKEEELRKSDPLLAFFLTIKQRLTDEGDAFWQSMKGTSMPALKGTVVSATPAARPKTLELAMSQSTQPELTLTLENPLPRRIEPGTVIHFEGAEPTEFTASPFMIKMQGGKITSGLPAAPPPPAKKAPAAKPKAAAKKG